MRSFLFHQPPRWQKTRLNPRQSLSPKLRSWVYEQSSLTQRLRAQYGEAVKVKVLLQRWHLPFFSERQALRLPLHRHCLLREVCLYVDELPLILARTVLPLPTIQIAHRKLSRLGTRPLGEVIFAYPNLARLSTEICHVAEKNWSANLKEILPIEHEIVGRRTVYTIDKHPMLVSEFFMPALLR